MLQRSLLGMWEVGEAGIGKIGLVRCCINKAINVDQNCRALNVTARQERCSEAYGRLTWPSFIYFPWYLDSQPDNPPVQVTAVKVCSQKLRECVFVTSGKKDQRGLRWGGLGRDWSLRVEHSWHSRPRKNFLRISCEQSHLAAGCSHLQFSETASAIGFWMLTQLLVYAGVSLRNCNDKYISSREDSSYRTKIRIFRL